MKRPGIVAAVPFAVVAATVTARSQATTYKNLQVLQDASGDLVRTMHVMRASLGVRCDYCHDVDRYEADTKPAKLAARRMILMTKELNRTAFEGRPVISCNSCHRGTVRPVSVPPIGQGQHADTTQTPAAAVARDPTPRDVIDRYLRALGGADRLRAARRRVAEGIVARPAIVPGQDGRPTAVNRGRSDRVVLEWTDNEIELTIGQDQDAVTQHVRGESGVVRTRSQERPMTPAEVDRLLMRFEPRRILTLLAETNTMTFVGRTDVGGRPAYVIERRIAGGKWEQLAFDVESALLRRSTIFSPTPVGPDPEQIDFDDYRIVNGLATPFVIRTSYLDDNHYGTTVRFASVRDTP